MTKSQKACKVLNERFQREIMPQKFLEKFGLEITTGWNFDEMCVYSTRTDGEDLTPEQIEYIRVFEDGYACAMNVVTNLAIVD